MYRIIKAENVEDGSDKLDEIKEKHSLEGNFWGFPQVGVSFYFEYNDDTRKMRRSSIVLEIARYNQYLRIRTLNTLYVFEDIG